ncbi:MAG TPA: multiheme c-type cytochrome [Myxococcota bacterium]|nr:multiheme c-type cytochrome [Myxococcota bacterium]
MIARLAPALCLLTALATSAAPDAGAQPAAPPAAAEHDGIGGDRGGRCHRKELYGDQVAAWRRDVHAGALDTLRSERSLAIAKERGLAALPHEAPECLSCHVTAHGAAPERIAYELDPADGVQCESCHGPGADYRKKKIMSDVDEAVARGLWRADEDPAICTACHNEKSPTWDPKRFVRPDGSSAGFDFELGKARFPHAIPEEARGKVVEIEEERRRERKEAEGE